MGVKKTEAEMKSLLSETIMAWCKDCLHHHAEVCVEGLLGITLNSNEIFLVSINQTISNTEEVNVEEESEDAAGKVLDLSEQKKSDSESDNESVKSSSGKIAKKKRRKPKKKDGQRSASPSEQTNENSPPCENDNDESTEKSYNLKKSTLPRSNRIKMLRNNRSSRSSKSCPYSNKKLKNRVQAYETQSQLVMVKEETVAAAAYQDYYANPPQPYLQDQINQPAVMTTVLPPTSPHNGAHQMPNVNSTSNAVAIPGSSEMIPTYDNQMHDHSGHIFRNLWPERKSNEKTCHFCGREFERPFNLKQHLRVHTGEKPFLCTLCGQTFTRKGNLKTHVQHQHSS